LAIERHSVYPFANLFATGQIDAGNIVRIDRDHNQARQNFTREVKDWATPARHVEPEALAGFLPANIGESVEVPAL